MKEARLITVWSIIFTMFVSILATILYKFYPNLLDYNGILTNIYCGVIATIVTSTVQYFAQKRKIINTVYGAYFDIYRTYYYVKNKHFLFHYNAFNVYKKLIELNPKIIETLDEYHGLFRKYDKTYKKLNPTLKLTDSYKIKNVLKTFINWFNKKNIEYSLEPLMLEIEGILKNINSKRFEQDKKEMIIMHDYMCK